MLAVERLLEREPSMRRKIRLIQVVVPSRTKVASYDELRQQLDQIVGRINGAYGTLNSVPIHYLYRDLPREQLAALYRAADVMLVTPLRDGMNLVAKEFIACRNDQDGVLVLSEFAGASAELAEAVTVNPYDIDRVASSIKDALVMPQYERRSRMRAMRNRIRAADSHHWARTFLEALQSTGLRVPASISVSAPHEIAELIEMLSESNRHLVLFLDYDGTLVPFADTPQLAVPTQELNVLLKALTRRGQTSVHVLSGRTRETIDRWLGNLPIALHAEHGFWTREPGGLWHAISSHSAPWKEQVLRTLEQFTEATPGSLIEEKAVALAWHYRKADPVFGALHAKELLSRLENDLSTLPVEILPGDKVIEVRERGINKGVIVKRVLDGLSEDVTALAMGDDRTDEDMFAALPADGISVHVGPNESRARYRLADPSAARSFLRALAEHSGPRKVRALRSPKLASIG